MNTTDQLLGELTQYGTPLLFGVMVVACAGVPLPATLLLIAAGSFADHGEMNGPAVIVVASAGAILGDQIGFALGRWGDRTLAGRISVWLGSPQRLAQAEAHARQWGGAGIFITRWLATPLGPFVNLVSGFTGYPWSRFILWDIFGELLWVGLFVGAGEVFGHQVLALSKFLGQITWAVAALSIAIVAGWMLLRDQKAVPGQK